MNCSLKKIKLSKFEFTEGKEEKNIPIIKLSRSINKETGTATFIFLEPTILKNEKSNAFQKLENLTLHWNNDILISDQLNLIFKNTHPFAIKAIFLLKKNEEWVFVFNFLRSYIRERGISF